MSDVSSTTPLISICLPTYNREDLLDLCLERLAELNRVNIDYEVVISDNCSTDRTEEVVRRRGADLKRVTFVRMKSNRGPLLNWHNAIRHAAGTFVIYLGDDDRLIPEALAEHLEMMRRRPDLVATYADWISYDDEAEKELHRYHTFLNGRLEFRQSEHMPLLDCILSYQVLPETGILRREQLLRALPFVKTGYPYLQYLYHMHRQGTIAFDPQPFYIENRVVKKHLDRSNWQGMGLWLVNDEMRMTLEMVVLKIFQDCGEPTVPEDVKMQVRTLIDGRLHQRLKLEAMVAAHYGNWILASELKRRWTLWRGNDSPLDAATEIDTVVIPAAMQAVSETFESGSECQRVAFHGFRTDAIPTLFRQMYPKIAVETSAPAADAALASGDRSYLHVVKSQAQLAERPLDGTVVLFDNLIDFYQTTAFAADFADL